MRPAMVVIVGALGGCALLGCSGETDLDTSRASEFGFQTAVLTSLIKQGKTEYETYCLGCHGENGDGKGDAAVFLNPKPRNFQVANFKFSSTRAGKLPTNDDLAQTIRTGLRGSAMPAFGLLPDQSIEALVAYVKTFSPKWTQRRPASGIPIGNDPYRNREDKTEALARGELIYHGYATCWTCHPSYVSVDKINEYLVAMENPSRDGFRSGLFESEGKPNSEGEMIYPPDFHRDFVRAGADVETLYRSISAGVSGTAMPTWVDSIDLPSVKDPTQRLVQPSDLWAMAYYVQYLIIQRPDRLTEGEVVVRDRPQPIYLHGDAPVITEPEPATTGEEFVEDEDD